MIIVMGLPGAGKSTVLAAAEGSGYKTINYGTEMFEIAKVKFGISDRDQLRKLTPEQQMEVQALVGKAIAQETGKVILDTHCTINTPQGYLPGLTQELLGMWKVERLVLVSAKLEDIMRRRNSDTTRVRDAQTMESLREHDGKNREYLEIYAKWAGSPTTIIMNNDGALEEAQAGFKALL